MKPLEFFDLTPNEVSIWLGPSWQGQMEIAWHQEAIHRMKRIPSKPSDLWKDKNRVMSDAQMFKHARAFMADLKKNQKKAPTKPPADLPTVKVKGSRK